MSLASIRVAAIEPQEWEAGISFEAFVAGAPPASGRRMRRNYAETAVPAPVVARWRRFAAAGGRLYVLAEDWCPDCMAVVPVVARLADEAGVPLRVFRRDSHPELRDRHLTQGKAKIPTVVAVQAGPEGRWHEVGRFVERPARLNDELARLPPEQRRSRLLQAYADGSFREPTLAELDAMLGADAS